MILTKSSKRLLDAGEHVRSTVVAIVLSFASYWFLFHDWHEWQQQPISAEWRLLHRQSCECVPHWVDEPGLESGFLSCLSTITQPRQRNASSILLYTYIYIYLHCGAACRYNTVALLRRRPTASGKQRELNRESHQLRRGTAIGCNSITNSRTVARGAPLTTRGLTIATGGIFS